MKLKTLAVGLCTIALLAGCGAKGDDAKSEKEDKTIRIGASVTPHAEILKHVKPALEKKGYKVEIEEFTDYVKPNQALVDDELDANFFQHKPYLVDWAKKANVSDKLTSVFAVHFEPLGIYSNNHTSLKEVADGQKISVPDVYKRQIHNKEWKLILLYLLFYLNSLYYFYYQYSLLLILFPLFLYLHVRI